MKLEEKGPKEADIEIVDEGEKMRREIFSLERQLAYKDGMIDGLKFAIRCNGVSGGEVR